MIGMWMKTFRNIIAGLYRMGIHLYPARLQKEYAREMETVFDLKARDAAGEGKRSMLRFTWREIRDLPAAIGMSHLEQWRQSLRRTNMFSKFFPTSQDQTPWSTALLSLIPLLITGPGMILYSYHPWWDPEKSPAYSIGFIILASIAILIGFSIGMIKKFPRWSYPYTLYVIVMLTFLATYLFNRTPWDINHEGFILLLIVALFILITWKIPAFRPFYANIRQDWTLLSYALYGCTLILLSTNDHDVVPDLNLFVMLPPIIGIVGALAHLRLGSSIQRFAVLLSGMLIGTFLIVLPMFSGMMGSWQSFMVVMGLLLTFWLILGALILAPILVNVSVQPRQAS
jgi:hypothetical protein